MTTALLTVADICLIEQQLNKIIQAKATSWIGFRCAMDRLGSRTTR